MQILGKGIGIRFKEIHGDLHFLTLSRKATCIIEVNGSLEYLFLFSEKNKA